MSHVSLCFLSFNRHDFITKAIRTAVQHAGEPVEVIVHDDGSHAPARERLVELMDEGLVSTLILNPIGHNQGQGVALNRMFRSASGDIIFKLDQDLVFKPGWLSTVRQILRDDRVGLLGLFRYLHDPVDARKTQLALPVALRPGTMARTAQLHDFHTHICGSGFAMPREVWETLGPFEEHSDAFAEDWRMQRNVYESEPWDCALPLTDLVDNIGFGIGPSTIALAGDRVQTINHGPRLVS